MKIGLLRTHQVTKMWRIEGSAENTDPHWCQRPPQLTAGPRPRAPSGPDVTTALNHVFERTQLAQADRSAGMELLG